MTPQSPLTATNTNNVSQDSAYQILTSVTGYTESYGMGGGNGLWQIVLAGFRPSATALAPFMRHRAMVISTQ
jgi:hypothetical protein